MSPIKIKANIRNCFYFLGISFRILQKQSSIIIVRKTKAHTRTLAHTLNLIPSLCTILLG